MASMAPIKCWCAFSSLLFSFCSISFSDRYVAVVHPERHSVYQDSLSIVCHIRRYSSGVLFAGFDEYIRESSNYFTVAMWSNGCWANLPQKLDKSDVPRLCFRKIAGEGVTWAKFNGTGWHVIGESLRISYGTIYMAFDSSNTQYIAYTDESVSGDLTVQSFSTMGTTTTWNLVCGCREVTHSGVSNVRLAVDGTDRAGFRSLTHQCIVQKNASAFDPGASSKGQ